MIKKVKRSITLKKMAKPKFQKWSRKITDTILWIIGIILILLIILRIFEVI